MRRALVAFAAVLALSVPAAADPVRITSGGFAATSLTDISPVALRGTRGFSLEARPGLGIFEPWACDFEPCGAGSVIDVRAFWSGLDLISTVTLDGRRFDNVGSASSNDFSLLDIRGALTLPSSPWTTSTFSAPFSLEGQFGWFDQATLTSEVVRLIGSGMATVSLTQSGAFADSWRVARIEYTFSDDTLVTPEPATLLLVGSGVALVARRRFRRSSRS